MKILAPSILSADLSNLAQQIRMVEIGGADWIHCDIMDGHFVPNITFGPVVVKAARKCTKLPLDVHLMIKNPDNYLEDFRNAGADIISVHFEEVVHLNRTVNRIKELGAKAGVVINPSTPVSFLKDIAEYIDLLLIMTVNPGFGGQSFIHSQLEKIKQIRAMIAVSGRDIELEVDGGINEQTAKLAIAAGADVLVAGNAVFSAGAEKYAENIRQLRGL